MNTIHTTHLGYEAEDSLALVIKHEVSEEHTQVVILWQSLLSRKEVFVTHLTDTTLLKLKEINRALNSTI